jgi:WD40 repeat protein
MLPDGRLVSGSWDNTIRLWDLTSGAETGRLGGHSGPVAVLRVLPDGRLGSGDRDKTIRLWKITARCEVSRLEVDADVTCHRLTLWHSPRRRRPSRALALAGGRWIESAGKTANAYSFRHRSFRRCRHLVKSQPPVFIAPGNFTHGKDSMGNDGEPGLVRWDRRYWHCMEETNAPPAEGSVKTTWK